MKPKAVDFVNWLSQVHTANGCTPSKVWVDPDLYRDLVSMLRIEPLTTAWVLTVYGVPVFAR